MANLVSQSQAVRSSHTDAHLDTGALQPTRHNVPLQTFQPGDDHNTDLLELLSGRSFSNGRISQLLNGSIVTLVQKLLTGREVLRIDGYIQISMLNEASTPIHVHLKESFSPDDTDNYYSSYSGTDTSLNLKAERPSQNSYATGEGCDKFPSGKSTEYPCTQIDRDYQTHKCSIDETVFKPEPDWVDEGHHKLESDEESGYSSTCDSVTQRQESPVFNRQLPEYIGGTCFTHGDDEQTSLLESEPRRRREQSCETSGSESSGSPGREEVDNADDDEKDEGVNHDTDDENGDEFGGPRLVIDLLSDVNNGDVQSQNDYVNQDITCEDVTLKRSCEVIQSDVTEKELSMGTEEKAFNWDNVSDDAYLGEIKHDCGNTLATCLSEHPYLRKTPSPASSESDDDTPMDLSVDSNLNMEPSISLHAQSVVSKHPDGLMCKLCFYVEPETHVFAEHVLNSHKLLCCTFCFRTFTAKNNLKRHMRIHTGLRPYKCSQCSQCFARRDDFKGHILRHDYNKPLRCSLCGKGYTDRTCVKKHMVKEHGSRLMRVCPQCGESFDSDDEFSNHKLSHPELEQFACDTCPFIGTNNLMRMKHSLFHSHRLFSCKPCNAHFADPFDYTDHVRKHRASPGFTSYTCCFCEMSLSTFEQFVRHEYSHAQGKTFCCSICQKQFKTKHAMRDHIRTHSTSCTDTPRMDDAGIPIITKPIFSEIADDEDIQANLQVRRIGAEGSSDGDPVVDLVEEPSSVEEQDCGELLDLSMKKPPMTVREVEKVSSGNLHATSNFGPCSNPSGLQRFGVPRNGYAPESAGKEQVAQVAERVHVTSAPLEESRVTEATFNITERNVTSSGSRLVLTSPRVSSFPQHFNFTESINGTMRNKESEHALDLRSQRSMDGHDCLLEKPRSYNRSVSSCERMSRPSHRFNPYMRDKMADLASKFVAARGFELSLPKHGSSSTKDFALTHRRQEIGIGVSNTKQHSNIPNFQLEERPIPVEGVNNNGGLDVRQNMPYSTASSVDHPKIEQKMRNRGHSPLNQVRGDIQASDVERNNSNNKDIDQNESQRQVSPVAPGTQRIPVTCELCQEEFPNFFDLESHSVQCHKRFLCQHCGKSFTARPNRDRHVRYHTGERPYKCDLCDLAFFRGDDLKYHRTTRHPTAQPFVCTKCSATFTWGRDLERHHRNSKCC